MTDQDFQDWFGPVIASYTDADAVADGVLIDITPLGIRFRGVPVHRITRNAWGKLLPTPWDREPSAAKRAIEHDLEGAHDTAAKGEEPDYLYETTSGRWLIKNELGGFTLMEKEDY